ncbi:cell cycle and apoptosis regulator protein 2-like isoform X1 [Sinocyclocheilus rhinocerous]|uniref:cell cycle and apoptosis regulator protein 2-like isoform X1 n=2 Tax=Sinocyclocheilus rhinocerous TaxID=307959 RepID=UPI0007B8F64C|nr:PREDICTED: cell cycle and apoptosis regulator protein 2-like isoform X1 [Sinocyclocheilus rhinocerous]XP_016422899.1 PREDICTED: cell cycle and apoptosis regulator protein 2-like isoform X2 [Sinocyclocheilus rhinocerous]XP_016422907.1 PREDICTED: cell cycle and apoptosis regulator protein 2-like isoform X1 [Sinocyclocheilus rhinocerous]
METQMRQRVFTGVVTQMQEHHGIVDQEVHFPVSVVVGRVPLVGEKVLVKAVQDPLKPISWTAQKVQTLNGQPFKSPPPLLPSMSSNPKPGILGTKPQPLLKSPKIPPLIPSMQPNPGGMMQMSHHQQMSWNGPFDGWGGGLKRHAEVMGGRRGGRWEDGGGGPWGGDAMHQKRKRWRAASEEEAPKKSSSISTHSAPLFTCFSRDTQACDYLELQRRYPHLHLPSNLFHLQLSWTESFPLDQPLPLRGPCHFHVGSNQPESEADVCESTDDAFSVRVLLFSMPCLEDLYSQCCNLSKDGRMQKEAVHPTTLLKFVMVDSGGELRLPGGHWSPKVDGANPAKDGSTLVNTAVRCIKEQTALDLSACTQWHKMAELRYLSGDKMQTVVVLLPDVWNLVPAEEDWAKLPQKQLDGDLSLPEGPSVVFHPSAGLNLSVVSLSSLLEPQTPQTRDSCEVSLMAEMFSEMLQRDFGLELYQCLCRLPQDPGIKEDNSAPMEDEPKKTDKQTAKKKGLIDAKKRKLKEKDGERETEDGALTDETVFQPVQSEHLKESKSQSAGGDNQPSKDSERPLGWTAELPRKVLLSWVFFDRQLTGSLRKADLLNILLSLGLFLSPAQAQDLVRKAAVGGLCLYRNLCSRWSDADRTDGSISAEGNKAMLPGQACKERASARRTGNTDLVNYRGNVINLPNLLQTLESSKAAQRELEKCVAALQSRLEAAEARQASNEQEQAHQKELKRKLEKAETLNKTYEKSLRENSGQMISVIEKMQRMVEQTTALTSAGKDKKA